MPLRDMLLNINTYPDPTPDSAVEQAVAFAHLTDGKLTALAVEINIPLYSDRSREVFLGLRGFAHEEEARSHRAMQAGLAHFSDIAEAAGVFAGVLEAKASIYDTSAAIAHRALARDICLVPCGDRFNDPAGVVQRILFDSGCPVIIFRAEGVQLPTVRLDSVVLAWDGSATAARAMRAALPLLQQTRQVHVVTFLAEKESARRGIGLEVVRHLAAHGIPAVAEEIPSAGRRIGECFDSYVDAMKPSLLVMGAYGHSRLLEFLLGGATRHALNGGTVATFLAH